jgi:hypothetical protein
MVGTNDAIKELTGAHVLEEPPQKCKSKTTIGSEYWGFVGNDISICNFTSASSLRHAVVVVNGILLTADGSTVTIRNRVQPRDIPLKNYFIAYNCTVCLVFVINS